MIIAKEFEFESAHKLPDYKGQCANLHGHSYKLIVAIEGPVNEKTGMVLDFKELSDIVKEKVITVFDHSYLNDILTNPTAEEIVSWIGNILNSEIERKYNGIIKLKYLKLYETSKNWVEQNY